VFHVYDHLHLERWPYRYVVEAGKSLVSPWATLENDGRYDLQVIGPNGFLRRIAGQLAEPSVASARPELRLDIIDANEGSLQLQAWNAGDVACEIKSSPNAYRSDAPFSLTLEPGAMPSSQTWSIRASGLWYDFTVTCPMLQGWSRQFAGRVENGRHGTSDPALCMDGQLYSRATRPRQRRASRAWLSK
jgi:phospholipase C